MSKGNNINRLGEEKLWRLLLEYATPAVIGMLVQALYNIVDRIFIGQGVGALGISGLTFTLPVIMLIFAFGMLLGIGAAARISIFLGKGKRDLAETVLGNTVTLSFITAVFTTMLPLMFLDELLMWFGASPETLPYAREYLEIVIPGSLLQILSFCFIFAMRASGYPARAMLVMFSGVGLNCILNPILIWGLDMGIRGAAVGTVISLLVSGIYAMTHFTNERSVVRLRWRCLRLRRHIVWSILTIGFSPFLIDVGSCAKMFVLNRVLERHGGDLTVGACGIILSIALIGVFIVIGIAQGMQPIVGFNHGAGRHDRVGGILRLSIIASSVVTVAGCAVSLLFPEVFIRMFTTDLELIAIAVVGLRLSMLMFWVAGSQIVIGMFFQSIGLAGPSIFLSICCQFVFYIPSTLIFASLWGVTGAWSAMAFSDAAGAVTAWLFLWYYVRRRKIVLSLDNFY